MSTIKDISFEPETRNCNTNKSRERKEFEEKLLEYHADNSLIVFMVKAYVNLYIIRTQSRSLRGEGCSTFLGASKSVNIHLTGCIDTKGLIHPEIHRGSYTEAAGNWT